MKKALLISCFSWYEQRLKPVRELLENDYKITVLTADYIHTRKQYIREDEKNPECEYIHVPAYKKNMSAFRFWSYYCFGKKVNKIIKQIEPDLVYILLPPNNTARYCEKYKKSHPQTELYVDIIDLWPESMPIPEVIKKTLICKKWSSFRNDSIKAANHLFVECDLYREILGKHIDNSKTTTLYLYRELDEKSKYDVLAQIEKKGSISKKKKISLCYLGSINHLIDIEEIQNLIKQLKMKKQIIELKIIGDGEAKDKLISAAERAGATVECYGKVYDQQEKIRLLGMCDFGLNMMKESVAVGLTIKSVDYLSMGIPIINTIKGDTMEFVKQRNIGINYTKGSNGWLREMLCTDSAKLSANAFNCFNECFTREAFQNAVKKTLFNKK